MSIIFHLDLHGSSSYSVRRHHHRWVCWELDVYEISRSSPGHCGHHAGNVAGLRTNGQHARHVRGGECTTGRMSRFSVTSSAEPRYVQIYQLHVWEYHVAHVASCSTRKATCLKGRLHKKPASWIYMWLRTCEGFKCLCQRSCSARKYINSNNIIGSNQF